MKIRQRYVCGEDKICIRYTYGRSGLIEGMEEVEFEFERDILDGELTMPRIEVTSAQFNQIINHGRLK